MKCKIKLPFHLLDVKQLNVQQLDKNGFIRNIIYLLISRQLNDKGINLFANKLKKANMKKDSYRTKVR